MRLVIVDKDGVAHTVTDRLEQFDLSRPLARAALVDDVLVTLHSIGEQQMQRDIEAMKG